MFGIELTTGQKVQIAAIILALTGAAFWLYRATRPVPDDKVNAWINPPHHYGQVANRPIGPNNPEDVKKEERVNCFVCQDGRLEITEFPNDPDRKPTVRWADVDTRRTTYIYYRNLNFHLLEIKDAFRHSLAFSTDYFIKNNPIDWATRVPPPRLVSLGFMGNAGLTDSEKTEAQKKLDELATYLSNLASEVENGTFKNGILDKNVMKEVASYKSVKGDPTKSPDKAEAVRKVLRVASDYLNTIDDQRWVYINKYIDSMSSLLDNNEKAAIVTAEKDYDARTNNRPIATAPPARRSAGTPGRGAGRAAGGGGAGAAGGAGGAGGAAGGGARGGAGGAAGGGGGRAGAGGAGGAAGAGGGGRTGAGGRNPAGPGNPTPAQPPATGG